MVILALYCYNSIMFKSLKEFFFSKTKVFINDNISILEKINFLEESYKNCSKKDFLLLGKKWKDIISKDPSQMDILLPDIFAAIREVSRRTINKRHFDVQLLAGIALHQGKIAEMKTGEGKTLVATLPAILNAFTGRNVHVVSVNDYLANRDKEFVQPVVEAFGLKVGCVTDDCSFESRRKAYFYNNITYASNNQIVFDFLRNNSSSITSMESKIQSDDLFYVIIDEADNVLIDEARTPLIISGEGEKKYLYYELINPVMKDLVLDVHYTISKNKSVYLTKNGYKLIEDFMIDRDIIKEKPYSSENIHLWFYVHNLARAYFTMKEDIDYIVTKDEVVIIDEFTGRLAKSRRYSNGLHQALEAKENVSIKSENEITASISYTNFFRMYEKTSGMTGTALSEEDELKEIYNKDIVSIPVNKPCIRKDNLNINLYTFKKDAIAGTADLIQDRHKKGQPILVGTCSVYESQILSQALLSRHIPHELLNAKNIEKEAFIVAQAGRSGSVTISTNIAGRGTDIPLGGDKDMEIKRILTEEEKAIRSEVAEVIHQQCEEDKKKVLASGGLLVIIFGVPESEKAEIQLRGRSGRQGDPGESIKIYSLEDDLLIGLRSDAINRRILESKFPPSKKVQRSDLAKSLIDKIQSEAQHSHFQSRKNLLKYDDITTAQLKEAYGYRNFIMSSVGNLKKNLQTIFDNIKDKKSLLKDLNLPNIFELQKKFKDKLNNLTLEEDEDKIQTLILREFDKLWKINIKNMDEVKRTIHVTSYSQKDPAQEYQEVGYRLFKEMIEQFSINTTKQFLEKGFETEDSFGFDLPEELDNIIKLMRNKEDSSLLNMDHNEIGYSFDLDSKDLELIEENIINKKQNNIITPEDITKEKKTINKKENSFSETELESNTPLDLNLSKKPADIISNEFSLDSSLDSKDLLKNIRPKRSKIKKNKIKDILHKKENMKTRKTKSSEIKKEIKINEIKNSKKKIRNILPKKIKNKANTNSKKSTVSKPNNFSKNNKIIEEFDQD